MDPADRNCPGDNWWSDMQAMSAEGKIGMQVHFFQDIGYRHNSMKHCPSYHRNNCACDAVEAVEFHKPSFGRCHAQWSNVEAASGA